MKNKDSAYIIEKYFTEISCWNNLSINKVKIYQERFKYSNFWVYLQICYIYLQV